MSESSGPPRRPTRVPVAAPAALAPPETPPEGAQLAPETGQAVRKSQNVLMDLAMKAKVQGDPTAYVLEAVAGAMGVIHRTLVDANVTIGEQIRQAIGKVVTTTVPPISPEKERELIQRIARAAVTAVDAQAVRVMRIQAFKMTVVILAAGLAIAAAGFGSGYGAGWISAPRAPGCEVQKDGSLLCPIQVWQPVAAPKK